MVEKKLEAGVTELALLKPKNGREPLLTFHFIMKCFHIFATPLVGNFFVSNWKWNLQTFHTCFLLLWTSILYSLNAYEFRHNTDEMFLSLIFELFNIMSIQRFYKFIQQRHLIMLCNEDIRVFTEKWEKRTEGYRILVWYYNLIKTLIIGGMAIFFTTAVIVVLMPIIIYIVTGRLQLVYQMYVPHLDYTTHPGFEIHIFLHSIPIFLFVDALTPLVGFVLITIIMICTRIDILCGRIRTLNSMIEEYNDPDENSKEITKLLKEIFEDHDHLLTYTDNCEELFSIQHLSDHFIVAAQICLSLYSIIKYSWYLGFAVIVVTTFMLFTINVLGTIIEIKFEKLLDDIWNIPWYLLDMKNKRSYSYFLGNSQKTDRLSVGGRVSLSLNTFVQLYKRIYSYLMILLEMEN
ncbi:putative odorant receptor 83c [Culicoides brevitarsis]|uniref:putative odorant receptor 83c n=1 Tax=Culicoides brevitarsis TaxID=469753 RepID=UPI00307B27D2